jgi:hypothetical protein
MRFLALFHGKYAGKVGLRNSFCLARSVKKAWYFQRDND